MNEVNCKNMLAASDNIAQARNSANPELKHLGQAPVRASRNRTSALSPSDQARSKAVPSPNGSPTEQVQDELPSNEEAALGIYDSKYISITEAKLLGQAPARAAIALFTEPNGRRHHFSDGKTELAASQSARNSDARDAEYSASMNTLLQQLDDLSKSKQRITEEFRASQQLTAQALRRLDEECERRQQLEHRVVDAEAARDVLSRAVEEKAQELELVRSKLNMAEARCVRLEQQLAMSSPNKMNPLESKMHTVQDAPALLPQPAEEQFQVRAFSESLGLLA